jgi:hypothetical protein
VNGGSLNLAGASTLNGTLTINNGVLFAGGNVSVIGAYTQTGGVMTGPGTVTVSGLLQWTNGTMSGAGSTHANGGLQLGINDGDTHSEALNARTLFNNGAGTWIASDTVTQDAGSSFQNVAGATLDIQPGAVWSGADSSDTLLNSGAITIDASSSKVAFNGYFVNSNPTASGTIAVDSGTLQLGGGGADNGSITVASGATLLFGQFSPSFAFTPPGTLMGAGTVELDGDSWATFAAGATYNVSGATFINGGELVLDNTSATMGTLNMTNGELSGSASVTVSGPIAWSGGTMTGSGSTDAKGGLQLGMSNASEATHEQLTGRTLINESTATMFALNTFTQSGGSTFENLATASLTVQGGSGWGNGADNSNPSFINDGAFIVAAGTATTEVQVYFNNAGAVQINTGTLGLCANGRATGSFSVVDGATLQFGNNFDYEAYTFTTSSTISGAGTVDFGSGVMANFIAGSTYNITGATVIDTGSDPDDNLLFSSGCNVLSVGDLTITSGVVNFSTGAIITVPNLTLNVGGTLTGSDSVVVSGATDWIDGSMAGTGSTTAAGGLTLGANDGANHGEDLEARTFINAATATWIGSGDMAIGSGATFVNQAGASFAEESPNDIGTDFGVGHEPSGTFDNEGTFTVNSGATASMDPFFQNSGSVEIQSGTWTLNGSGSASGTFQVDNGAVFNLNKFYGFPAANVTGPGTVNLIDGSQAAPVAFTGGDIPVTNGPSFFEVTGNTSVASLNMTSGFLIVDGTLTVTGAMLWDGGYIVGPGKIIAQGGLTLGETTDEDMALEGTTLVNVGAGTMSGQAQIDMGEGAVFINQQGATLAILGGGSDIFPDGTITLFNQGSITATVGSGTVYTIGPATLDNSGSISVTSGTLDLETGGVASGIFNVAAGSTLELDQFSWAFDAGSSVGGAGTVDFNYNAYGSNFYSGSTYNVSGATILESQSTLVFSSGSEVENTGALSLLNGGVNFSTGAAVSIASLSEQGGELTGPDTVTISGSTLWTGGDMTGTGVTSADGGLTIGINNNIGMATSLQERTLVNSGTGTITGSLTMEEVFGAVFVNSKNATLTIASDMDWYDNGDNNSTIENDGAITVDAGIGTVLIYSGSQEPSFLTNTGSIEVSSGTLDLQVDGASTGSLTADGGAILEFGSNSTFLLNAGSVTGGPGTVEFDGLITKMDADASYNGTGVTSIGGAIEFDGSTNLVTLNLLDGGNLTGSGTVTVSGVTTWTGGTMSGPGTTVPSGGLMIGQAADTDDNETLSGRTLNNTATTTWAGGGNFAQNDGSVFDNQAGATFDIENDIGWNSDGTAVFDNAGTFIKSAISATTSFSTALNNDNSVQVQQGTLSLQAGGILGGTYSITPTGTLAVGADAITTTNPAFPSVFTSGNWAGTFSGTATDGSGSGLASVGVSLFDGTNYFDGTGFTSTTPVFNPATLTGSDWTYTIPIGDFTSDVTYTVQSKALDNNGGTEPSTTTLLTLSLAGPQLAAIAPPVGPVTGGTNVTISGSYLSGATLVEFGTNNPGTIVSSTPNAIVVTIPAGTLGTTDVTVTTDLGTTTISMADHFKYNPLPISIVTALPAFSKPSFTVSWSGTDVGGSGIGTYDVFVSDNGGDFTPFLTGTTQTSATFSGVAGHTYGFYSVAIDSEGVRGATPAAAQATTQTLLDTPSKVYIDAVYEDLLGRGPDVTGLDYWSGQLDQGGARATLINLIDHSAEYFGTIIKPAYLQYLGRAADAAGLAYWTGQMVNGLTDQQLEAGFIASDEFFTKSGGTNATWVNALYQSLLGRPADPTGEAFWTQQLAGGATRDSVAFGFADSTEREGQLVEADYEQFLGRKAGSSEIAYWVGQFSLGVTNEDIVTGFVSSDEYYNKKTG